jgi:hypothetical protein
VLAQAAGRNTLSDQELSEVLAMTTDYPVMVHSRARTKVETPLAALADLRAGILLMSAQLRLGGDGVDDRADLLSLLGQDVALHGALTSMLGRSDHIAVEGALPDFSAVPLFVLCSAVTTADGAGWRQDAALQGLVKEAASRDYSPFDCRLALGSLPRRTVLADRPDSKLIGEGF